MEKNASELLPAEVDPTVATAKSENGIPSRSSEPVTRVRPNGRCQNTESRRLLGGLCIVKLGTALPPWSLIDGAVRNFSPRHGQLKRCVPLV